MRRGGRVGGRRREARDEFEELFGGINEAVADISGIALGLALEFRPESHDRILAAGTRYVELTDRLRAVLRRM